MGSYQGNRRIPKIKDFLKLRLGKSVKVGKVAMDSMGMTK